MRTTDDDAYFSARALAAKFGKDYHRLRKRLERWRRAGRCGYDWKEVNDLTGGQEQYLYRLGSVRHIIDAIA